MSAKVTSAQLVIKQLQYIEEVTEGTTPSSSPTFNECGKIQSLSFTRDNSEIEVGQIGPEDLYNLLQGKTVSGFKVKMAIFSSTFLKYCINAANYGTPAGTISTPLSFVFSYYLNGVENFVFFRGARCINWTLEGDISSVITFSAEFHCIAVTEPNSSSGLTTPTYITPSSSAVWSWLSGGSAPVQWNSSGVNAIKISVTGNRNTAEDYTLGNAAPYTIQPHGRRIAFTLTILRTGVTLSGDQNTATLRTLAWTLMTATSTITLTNSVLDKLSEERNYDDTKSVAETYNGKCTAVSIP